MDLLSTTALFEHRHHNPAAWREAGVVQHLHKAMNAFCRWLYDYKPSGHDAAVPKDTVSPLLTTVPPSLRG